MMTMRRHPAALVSAALLAAGAVTALAQQPASPPRGASGPPEHAKVAPSTTCPTPTRRCATGARCPTAASGDRSAPCRSTSMASTSGPAIAAAPIPAPARRSTRSSSSIPRQGRQELRRRTDSLAARHGRRQAGQRLGRGRASGNRRGAETVPRRRGQGAHRDQVQPRRQGAAGARHAGQGRQPARGLHRAERRRHRPRRQHLRRRVAWRAVHGREPHPAASGGSRSSRRDGKFVKSFGAYGFGPERVPRPARAGLRLERPAVRRGSRQPPHPDLRSGRQAPRHAGTSSAASAAWRSPPTTRSMPSTRSRTTTTTPAGARDSGSAARAPARSGTSCPSTCPSRPRAWAVTARWARA